MRRGHVMVVMERESKVTAEMATIDAKKAINVALHELYLASKGRYVRRGDPVSQAITRLEYAFRDVDRANTLIWNYVETREEGQSE